jgi:protein-disulfide isomerase
MRKAEHPDEMTIMAWTDGEVPAATAASIQAHVASCAVCAKAAHDFGAVSARLGAWKVETATFKLADAPPGPSRYLRWAAAACLALGLISVPAWRWTADRRGANGAPALSANILLPGAVRAAGLWSATPRVTLTVFVDWQCPACATSYPAYFELMKEYEESAPGQVALVIKDFPLDSKCNTLVHTRVHPAACEAAAAVRMARARGRGDEMIGFLIAHVTPHLEPDAIRAAAAHILGPFDFDAAYASERQRIQEDVSEAAVRNVKYTPSFFINDTPLASNGMGLPTAADLRTAIDAQLRSQQRTYGCPDGRRAMRLGGCR